MATEQIPTDPDEILAALGKASTRIERLDAQLKSARRLRHRLMHAAAAIGDGAGGRLLSNYRIAKSAGVRSQAVDQVLAKPLPQDEK